MKVSVIIPNYNHAPYLDARIQSVLNQTYQDFEIIILDDCSSDRSREVIEKYRSDPHVTSIEYNNENCGKVFSQWKKGISLANGELIWIAESDDLSDDNFLELLSAKFKEHPSLSLAFCKSWMFDNDGNKWAAHQERVSEGFYNGKSFISDYMSRSCIMYNASACVFRKSSFNAIDDIYTTFRASGDRMFWTLICEQGDVYVVDERLNHYRRHGKNSTDHTFLQGINQKEAKRIMDYILFKGYINKKTYKETRDTLLKEYVFEFLTDKSLKKEIYDYWGYNYIQQTKLKIHAYAKKIKRFFE